MIEHVVEHGTLLGEASIGANGRWTISSEEMLAGYHQFVALARDTEGAVAHSTVARTTVGTENLAFGRPVSASSRDKSGGPAEDAVDGDPWTAWWADHEEREEPQWLQVDLGAVRTVGAVGTLWWKVYPQDYRVQVSGDGENWREVARAENQGYPPRGVSDVLRFEPVHPGSEEGHADRAVSLPVNRMVLSAFGFHAAGKNLRRTSLTGHGGFRRIRTSRRQVRDRLIEYLPKAGTMTKRTKAKIPRPTDAELDILRVLWQRGPSTVREVQKVLSESKPTGYTTALKLMQIMTEKGLLSRDESQRTHVYRPRVPAESTQRQLVAHLLERAFVGAANQLVMQALSAKPVSREELNEIRSLLDEMEQELK